MTDPWFLDLDGVRSGPYQTSEILNLIAEGEVLPHHRIAQNLKDSTWKTILEWRLEQSRQAPPRKTPAPIDTTRIFKNEPIVTPVPPVAQENPPPPNPPPIPTFSTAQAEFLKEVENLEKTLADQIPPGEKRDAMAEMFDIIQNTKQKREAKQIQSALIASKDSTSGKPVQNQSIGKLIAICIAVSLVGLALGQWFQASNTASHSPNTNPSKPQEKIASDVKPSAKTEVVDRSTEKMTIRAVVEKKPEGGLPQRSIPTAPKGPIHSSSSSTPPPAKEEDSTPSAKKTSDREVEELQDLKKELQELKALKEQLKDAPLNDDFNDGDFVPYDNSGGSFGNPPNHSGNGIDAAPSPGNTPTQSPQPGDIRY